MQQHAGPPVAHFLTIPEAARRLGVSPDTVRRRIKSGELAARLFARKYRIRVEDVDALVTPCADGSDTPGHGVAA